MTLEQLQALLHFRGQALTQFLLVATIFGAFSIGGVIALIATNEKPRVRSTLFLLLSLASIAFIFATLISVLILPFMGTGVQLTEKATRGLLFLYSVVVVAIIVGTLLLGAGIAGVGFMVSRRLGHCTLWFTVGAAVVSILCVVFLYGIMR